jgi:hypothetical protein
MRCDLQRRAAISNARDSEGARRYAGRGGPSYGRIGSICGGFFVGFGSVFSMTCLIHSTCSV